MLRSSGVERHYCSHACDESDRYQWLRENTRRYHKQAANNLQSVIHAHIELIHPRSLRVAAEMGDIANHSLIKTHLQQTYSHLVNGVANALRDAFSLQVGMDYNEKKNKSKRGESKKAKRKVQVEEEKEEHN